MSPTQFASEMTGNTPAYRAHSQWSPLQAVGFALVISALSAAAGIVVTAAVSKTAEGRASDAIMVFGLLAAQMTMIGGTLWAARGKGGSGLSSLALRAPAQGWKAYPLALMTMVALVTVLNALLARLLGHDLTADLKTFAGLIRGPWGVMAIAIVGIGAPVSEELLFRGFLQGSLWRSQLGFWGAAVIATALWTALHAGYSAIGLAEVFLIGLLFSFYLRATGSLRVPMFCHAAYNLALAVGVRYLPADVLGF